MKKILSCMILSSLACTVAAKGETILSAENMDDFHPEISAGKVPMPEVRTTEEKTDSLAVIPFEEGDLPTENKGKIEEIEIYPTGQGQWRKTSEPDNPVNNVLKTEKKTGEVMQAPTLKIGPQNQIPENLFGKL
ncbi:hypothetical protein FAI41_04210 [Acetobacteraceae bacterium]|nr:hypothetical protein FAI41_04210 [Acetobacteraceae bacterium]